jgi:hypothetical protein
MVLLLAVVCPLPLSCGGPDLDRAAVEVGRRPLIGRTAADCAPAWRLVPGANGSGDENSLGDVAVIDATNIWAVGSSGAGLVGDRTLAERWDGSGWTVFPTPNGTMASTVLTGVATVSSTDVWAVGYTWNGSIPTPVSRTFIAHWNGSSWSQVSSPNTGRPENYLYGVVAISRNDVWAVGTAVDTSQFNTLIMHWNGSKWSIVASPNPEFFANILYDVDAAAANDIWAVGSREESLEQTLVLHWNGSSWKVVPSPQVGPFGNNMVSVSVVSPSDIWAVGYHLAVFGVDQVMQTSAFHYDGTSWSVVPSPNANQRNNYVSDVVGIAANDAWTVGFFDTGFSFQNLIQHWDGNSWSLVDSPNPGNLNTPDAVAAVSGSDVWTVGSFVDGPVGRNVLVERFSTDCGVAMHVAAITPSFVRRSGRFQVRADVDVVDGDSAPVAGARIDVDATKPDGTVVALSATTSASGRARVSLTSSQRGTFTFTVTNVSKSGANYDPGANQETSDSIAVR